MTKRGADSLWRLRLGSSESIVWSGQPEPTCKELTGRKLSLWAVIFGVTVLPAATYFLMMLLGRDDLAVRGVAAFLLLDMFWILLLVLYLAIVRPFILRRRVRRIHYAVTNNRVLIAKNDGEELVVIEPQDLAPLPRDTGTNLQRATIQLRPWREGLNWKRNQRLREDNALWEIEDYSNVLAALKPVRDSGIDLRKTPPQWADQISASES